MSQQLCTEFISAVDRLSTATVLRDDLSVWMFLCLSKLMLHNLSSMKQTHSIHPPHPSISVGILFVVKNELLL